MPNYINFCIFCLIMFFVVSLATFSNGAESLDEAGMTDDQSEKILTPPDALTDKDDKEFYDHQRIYCVKYWNHYYSKMKKSNIEVSSKGEYDEVVVFSCPDCSLEEHYVEPFLNTEVDGVTGFDRIKECGFTKAVFKGSKGLREIVREVN